LKAPLFDEIGKHAFQKKKTPTSFSTCCTFAFKFNGNADITFECPQWPIIQVRQEDSQSYFYWQHFIKKKNSKFIKKVILEVFS
jgi:hypothetical protein